MLKVKVVATRQTDWQVAEFSYSYDFSLILLLVNRVVHTCTMILVTQYHLNIRHCLKLTPMSFCISWCQKLNALNWLEPSSQGPRMVLKYRQDVIPNAFAIVQYQWQYKYRVCHLGEFIEELYPSPHNLRSTLVVKYMYRICTQIVGHSVHTLVLVPNPSMKCLVPGTSHALLVAWFN